MFKVRVMVKVYSSGITLDVGFRVRVRVCLFFVFLSVFKNLLG